MEEILIQVLFAIIAYLLVYFIYYITVINKPKKLAKFMNGTEMTILKKKFNVNVDNQDYKKIAKTIAKTNAFIIGLCFGIVTMIKSFWLSLIAGFIIMVILIIICYIIIGKKLGVK